MAVAGASIKITDYYYPEISTVLNGKLNFSLQLFGNILICQNHHSFLLHSSPTVKGIFP